MIKFFKNLFSRQKTTEKNITIKEPAQEVITQGFEDYRHFFWGDILRNDEIIDYKSFREAYKKHKAVFICVNKLVRNILGRGWEIVETEAKVKREANRELLKDLFGRNEKYKIHDFLDFYSIMYSSLVDFFIDGAKVMFINPENAWIQPDIDFGTLRPRMNEYGFFKHDGKGDWVQIIDGTIKTRFDNEDVIFLRFPDRTQFIFPESPLLPVLVDIETDLFGREFNKMRFIKAASFGAVFVLPETSKEKDALKLLNYIKNNYVPKRTGFGEITNNFKPIVLFGGAKLDKSIAENFKDIDFLKLKKFTIEEVAMVYEIPPRLLGLEQQGLGQAGANKEALVQFYKVIANWQKVIEEQFNKQYIRDRLQIYDYELRFIKPKYIDIADEVKSHTELVNMGIETPYEARENLSVFYPNLKGDFNENVSFLKNTKEIPEPKKETKKIAYIGQRAKKKIVRREWDFVRVKKSLDSVEEKVIKEATRIFEKIRNNAVQRTLAIYRTESPTKIKDLKLMFVSNLAKAYIDGAIEAFEKGKADFKAQVSMARLNPEDFYTGAKILSWVKAQADLSARKEAEDLLNQIKIAVSNAMVKGKSENELMAIVNDVFERNIARINTIVRTNTTSFYNKGHVNQIYAAKDFVPKVQYSAILDGRTTERCTRLDGTITEVNSSLFDEIQPPQHFNCRSILVPVTKIDIQEKPEDFKTTDKDKILSIIANTAGFDIIH